MKVIMLSGKSCSGKDVIANKLKAQYETKKGESINNSFCGFS